MAQGHTLPLIDIAKLFASRGVKSTIITTPINESIFTKAIQPSQSFRFEIELVVIQFPSAAVGLPEGIESTKLLRTKEMREKFFKAITLLEQQVEQILDQHHPHCLVADSLFHWATDVAAKFGIPRLIFHGPGFFPMCAAISVMRYQPQAKVSSDSEPFVIPGLPDEIDPKPSKRLFVFDIDDDDDDSKEKEMDEVLRRKCRLAKFRHGKMYPWLVELNGDLYAMCFHSTMGYSGMSVSEVYRHQSKRWETLPEPVVDFHNIEMETFYSYAVTGNKMVVPKHKPSTQVIDQD